MPKAYSRHFLIGTGTGFHFSAPPPSGIKRPEFHQGSDIDDVISSILANARDGDFGPCRRLPEIMKTHDDAWVWGCCSMLLSYAAPGSVLREMVSTFSPRIELGDDSTTQWVVEILGQSKLLWAVPEMIRLYGLIKDRDKYSSAPHYLSLLLEKERGPVDDGPPLVPQPDHPDWYDPPPVYDFEGYRRLVDAKYAELCEAVGDTSPRCVFEGESLSLRRVALRLLDRIRAGEDIHMIGIGRAILEAYTGSDFTTFFLDGRLRPLSALALVEEFLESDEADRYEPGVRYFFGRVIPE